MSATIKLSEAQRTLLTAAADRGGELPAGLPLSLKGGALAKVIGSLERQGLLKVRKSGYRITKAGYAAIGRATARTAPASPQAAPTRRTRDNSKQAQVIALLRRPEGATIAQVRAVTDWLPHTVRGFFSGALRNKLGLYVVTERIAGKQVYRIA
jgi:hypothetical protein